MNYHIKSYGLHSETHSSLEANATDLHHETEDQSSEDSDSEVEVIEEESSDVAKEDDEMSEGPEESEPQTIPDSDTQTYKEEMPDAVEFLSVECDMILEPDCHLETNGTHPSYKNGQEKGDKKMIQNPAMPILYQIPFISELFRYRDVDVYKRTCKDGPFVKIFNPEKKIRRNYVKNKHDNHNNLVVPVYGEKGKDKLYSCTENERVSIKEKDTEDLMKDQMNNMPSKCEVCHMQFMNKNALMIHKLTHTIVVGKSYPCTVCKATFRSKTLLRSHIQRHFCLKSVQCQFCDKKFQSNNQLIVHQRIHIGERPFQCQHCEKNFTYKFQFDSHQKVHVGKSLLKCEYCDDTFTQKQALIVHERKHTGEKPFKCEKCGAAFRVRSYLRAHKKCHMDRKPRECPDCGSQFWKSSSLKKHRKAEHD
ncbi:gastrula zinc finger protein XlCGF57.1 [Procambarus clarkii]|uniref:gastrula zinc finger protein XlCGF57.1 n=1 Tax=Procambarus clarkii TaxID=6728 RepID=UPI001E6743BD|nr:zinc finger protein 1-like [Procambarus clarkii]